MALLRASLGLGEVVEVDGAFADFDTGDFGALVGFAALGVVEGLGDFGGGDRDHAVAVADDPVAVVDGDGMPR